MRCGLVGVVWTYWKKCVKQGGFGVSNSQARPSVFLLLDV